MQNSEQKRALSISDKTNFYPLRWFVLLILGITVVYPLLHLLDRSTVVDGGRSLRNYLHFWNWNAPFLDALWGSVWISVASVFFAGIIGVSLAFLFERVDLPAKSFLSAVATLPIVLPPLVGVVAFVFLWGESGIIPRFLQFAFELSAPPFYLEGLSAIIFIHAYSFYVYFFLFTRAAFQRMDGATIEAAQSLGASYFTILARVIFPQLRPAISSAAILVFMISMASFSAPFLFGGEYRVLTVEIYNSKLQGDMPMAMTQSVMLGVISLLFLFLNLQTESEASGTGQKGVPLPPRPIQRVLYRRIALFIAVVVSLILASPHLTLLLLSFAQNGSWTSQIIPETFTLANYTSLFFNHKVSEPIMNSSMMAVLATTMNFIIALAAAFWITQRRWRAGRVAELMIMIPWAIPGTVVAIALIVVFNTGHWFTAGAILVGSFWILPLAYFIRHLPIVYRAAHAAFSRLDPFQEEAALSLGGSAWLTFRKVIFPAVRPGVMAGVLLAMVMSLGEFVSSILLYTFTNRPISMAILNEMRLLNLGTAAAYGVMLTIIIFVITWLANRWDE